MKTSYHHLGVFSDLVATARRSHPIFPLAKPVPGTRRLAREILGFSSDPERPHQVRIERSWKKDGIEGEEISWWVGYGPRPKAWLLRPAGAKVPLPGVLALHDHGGFKFYGREKIADDQSRPNEVLVKFRKLCYGGRAFANELAREGFAVLVNDVFLWGSRRFPLKTMPDFDRQSGRLLLPLWYGAKLPRRGLFREIAEYNACAGYHETTVAKYCALLGLTLAGIVAHEDRIAANYLAGRSDICNGHIGCVGLSGGGMRSGLLQASCNHIRASVVVGAMSTSEGLLDHNVINHTWMLFPTGWCRHGDWSDLVGCRAPSPLLVQYDREDPLFTMAGMKAADRRLKAHYRQAGAVNNYRGEFYPGPHKFDLPMQQAAFAWLKKQLC
jgi:dienelactone hydrolase